MTVSGKTCDYQWPLLVKGVDIGIDHRCVLLTGHGDWHKCRDGARRDADLPPSTAAPQPSAPAPPHFREPGNGWGPLRCRS